jgi:hypothetical protein
MHVPEAVSQLTRDLQTIFGDRLHAVIAYSVQAADGTPAPTLAVVDRLSTDDLHACAARVAAWHEDNLRTPLLIPVAELSRSLDAFPLEFAAILSRYRVVFGTDPFIGVQVQRTHLRIACEVQARSHLLHLREDYLETQGRASALAELIVESAPALASLVRSVAMLEGVDASTPAAAARQVERLLNVAEGTLAEVVELATTRAPGSEDARGRWPAYLEAVERLTRHVDSSGSA